MDIKEYELITAGLLGIVLGVALVCVLIITGVVQ